MLLAKDVRYLALTLVLLLLPAAAQAQDEAAPRPEDASEDADGLRFFHGQMGLGPGGAGYDEATLNAGLSLTFATNRYAFTARLYGATEVNWFGFSESVSDVSALAGVRHRFADGWFMAQAQAGPGLVLETRRGDPKPNNCGRSFFCFQEYEAEVARALGVSGQAELLFTPIPYAAIGLGFSGNVNGMRSYGGMSFALHVGYMY